ncbi:MAG: glycosyltransferase, partial [Halobacteriaceae archaeon]
AADNEDFGIVPIESFAAGTPVLGVRDGFTQYQIKAGKNGLLFNRTETAIQETVRQFEQTGVRWTARQMHEFSEQFSRERFCREMRKAVSRAEQANQIDVNLNEPMPVVE